jgi:hypothetical protein
MNNDLHVEQENRPTVLNGGLKNTKIKCAFNMTDEQINAAIARVCGWTNVNEAHRSGKAPGADYVGQEFIPDYCNDLNAIHEAENYLGESTNMVEYTNMLYDMACIVQTMTNRWNPYGLPARYRAEAFLRTLGKWHEETQQ